MGCGTSRESQPGPKGQLYTTGLVHDSRKSYKDVPLDKLYQELEDALLQDVQENRKDRAAANKRLGESRGAEGLQARGVLMFVYSTPESSFRDFLADSPEYVNLPTFGANAYNAIPGSYMLARVGELAAGVQRAAGGGGGGGGEEGGAEAVVAPNAPLLGTPLQNMLKLKAMWGRKLLAVTLLMVRHPVCGTMALVQPLLGAACMARLTNWAPDLDPVFEVLLQAGASPRVRNSLNMTPLMLLAVTLANELDKALYNVNSSRGAGAGEEQQGQEQAAAALGGSFTEAVRLAVSAARRLVAAGADPRDSMAGFGARWEAAAEREREAALPGPLRPARAVLHLDSYTAAEALSLMLAPFARLLGSAPAETRQALAELEALLGGDPSGCDPAPAEPSSEQGSLQTGSAIRLAEGAASADGIPVEVTQAGNGAGEAATAELAVAAADGGGRGMALGQQQQQQPAARAVAPVPAPRGVTWPWVQAMSNIAWAVSQVTLAPTAAARRELLRHLVRQAPFELPGMAVVSVAQLRDAGAIPRYATGQDGPAPSGSPPGSGVSCFRPLPVDVLPPGSLVVFVSHRWLGRGCPDDEQGTKLKQVLAVADHVAAMRGVPVEQVFLWLDYSVVDQSNPMPGVQALPVYIACCDEFVYVEHPEYWQRAWCLTEQFMHWKLASSELKHALSPASSSIRAESARQRPPDPTYGRLAVEADRVALATMTSIMPYDDG